MRTPTIRITLACECGRWFTLSGTRAGHLVSCPSCRRHAFSPIAGEPYEGHFTRITPDFTAWTVHHAARCTAVLALVVAVLACWSLAYVIQGGVPALVVRVLEVSHLVARVTRGLVEKGLITRT